MGILDRIQKAKEEGRYNKQRMYDLSICERCGKKMINNTFKHGSRLGGSFDCLCGNQIMF